MQHLLVLGDLFLALDLGAQGDLGAVDRDLDVFLANPGQLGADHVGAVLLGHIHLHSR